MKVGTDAVLLGAWAGVEQCRRVLDLGCGSGVIALMVAQRAPEAQVTGIDIDEAAVGQAEENGAASPFAQRVSFLTCDVRNFQDEEGFDAIVCNPPFYTEDTLPPDSLRAVARHSHDLTFAQLLHHAVRLLRPDGNLHVVLPAGAEPQFSQLCLAEGLYPARLCTIKTTPRKSPKRVLCTYSKVLSQQVVFEQLILMENGARSEEYQRLTADFYLDFPRPS